jgi:hypothetical protein
VWIPGFQKIPETKLLSRHTFSSGWFAIYPLSKGAWMEKCTNFYNIKSILLESKYIFIIYIFYVIDNNNSEKIWSWMKASDTFEVHDNSEKICYILWITWINQLEQVKSNYDHQKSIRRKS